MKFKCTKFKHMKISLSNIQFCVDYTKILRPLKLSTLWQKQRTEAVFPKVCAHPNCSIVRSCGYHLWSSTRCRAAIDIRAVTLELLNPGSDLHVPDSSHLVHTHTEQHAAGRREHLFRDESILQSHRQCNELA